MYPIGFTTALTKQWQYFALTPFFTPMAKVIPSDNHPQWARAARM
jgi:hypothetical protein